MLMERPSHSKLMTFIPYWYKAIQSPLVRQHALKLVLVTGYYPIFRKNTEEYPGDPRTPHILEPTHTLTGWKVTILEIPGTLFDSSEIMEPTVP